MRILVVGDFQGVFSEKMKNKLRNEDFDLIAGVGDYAGLAEWKPFVMHVLREVKEGKPHPSAEKFFGKNRLKKLLKKDRDATKNVLRELNNFDKPVIFVFGNGDDDWYKYKFEKSEDLKKRNLKVIKSLKNMTDITYGQTKLKRVNFIGFGGYMDIDSYFNRKEWKDESEEKIIMRILRREISKNYFFKLLNKAKGEKIFVLHYPPQGVFDIIRDIKDNPMNGKSAGIGFFREAIKKFKPRLVLCGHMHEYQGIKKIHGVPVINPGDAEKGKYAIVEIPEGKKGKIKVRFER